MKNNLRKITLLVVFSLLLNNFTFAGVDPIGYIEPPPPYQDPRYSIFLQDLHSWIEEFFNISTTPPTEAVPVFPYDPILYQLLRYGFNLQAGSTLKTTDIVLRSYLEQTKKLDENLRYAIQALEMMGYVRGIVSNSNLDLSNPFVAAFSEWNSYRQRYKALIEAGKFYSGKCLDPEFAPYHLSVIEAIGNGGLEDYATQIINNIEICQTQTPSFAFQKQNKQIGLLGKIISAFSGRIFLAQTSNDLNQSTLPSVRLQNGLGYTFADLENSILISNVANNAIALISDPGLMELSPFGKTAVPVEFIKANKNGNTLLVPHGFVDLYFTPKPSEIFSGDKISSNPSFTSLVESVPIVGGFSNITGGDEWKDIFLGLFTKNPDLKKTLLEEDFSDPLELLKKIDKFCGQQIVTPQDAKNILRSSAYSDCVHKAVQDLVNDMNRIIDAVLIIKEGLEKYNELFIRVIGHASNYIPSYDTAARKLLGSFESSQRRIQSVIDKINGNPKLEKINYNELKNPNCSYPCTIEKYYGSGFVYIVKPRIEKLREVLKTAFIGELTTVSRAAFDFRPAYLLNALASAYKGEPGVNIITPQNFAQKNRNIFVKKEIIITKKTLELKTNFNFLSFISNIFKPKEVNIIRK